MHDYRERDKELRKPYLHRPPDERSDRPTSSSFVVPSSSHMNGSGGVGSSTSSPKGQAIWSEDASYRMPPTGYMGHEVHRSPVQAQRYTPGGPPSGRGLSIHRMVSPPPVNRARPPPSPYSHPSNLHRSPPTSPRLPPRSPSSTKPLLRTATPTGQRHSSSHTHTPSGHHPPLTQNGTTTTNYAGGRTESPRVSGAMHSSSSSRQGLNGSGDGERQHQHQHPMSALSPRLGASVGGIHHSTKMSVTPVADRR